MNELCLIVAYDNNKLIGNENNDMPWGMSLKEDLKRVKKLTEGNTIVMGRRTYESIGRPLPNRLNIVLTKDSKFKVSDKFKNVKVLHNIEDVYKLEGKVFIFGGSSIYNLFINDVSKMFVTEVLGDFKGDTYFCKFNEKDYKIVNESAVIEDEGSNIKYKFIDYEKTR